MPHTKKTHTRLSLDVSSELNETLDKMSKDTHSTKSDVLRKSIALMEIAIRERARENHLAVVGKNNKILKEIIGL